MNDDSGTDCVTALPDVTAILNKCPSAVVSYVFSDVRDPINNSLTQCVIETKNTTVVVVRKCTDGMHATTFHPSTHILDTLAYHLNQVGTV